MSELTEKEVIEALHDPDAAVVVLRGDGLVDSNLPVEESFDQSRSEPAEDLGLPREHNIGDDPLGFDK